MDMKIEVLEEKVNPYLNRREILLEVFHKGQRTPSKREVSNILVDKLGLDPDKTMIMYIKTATGMNRSLIFLHYYPDGIDWSQIEPPDRGKLATNYIEKT